jgi:hypothetical protein
LTAKSEENLSTEPVKGLKELIKEEKKKLQDAIDAKHGSTQELTVKSEENLSTEPVKGLKELVKEEKKRLHDAINAKQLNATDVPKETPKIENVKGLKEMIREEKKKLAEERKLKESNKSDEFETVSDLEQSGNNTLNITKRTEQKSDNDQDEEAEEEEEEGEEEEEEEDEEPEPEKKTENLEKTIKIQSKPAEISQTPTKEDENKKKSMFFGIFKSKSTNSLTKDAIKKLEAEKQETEKLQLEFIVK